jgi:RimJ/RimL family protein N-acetyltransferase
MEYRRDMSIAFRPTLEVPVVETERLRLRRHRVEDFAASCAIWTDPTVVRYITGKPLSTEDVWGRMLRYVGHWALQGYGFWAVEEKATGAMIGDLGMAEFKRDVVPGFDGVPELGWVLAAQAHGKGYATEAVRAAVTWGERSLGTRRMVCIIDPENRASIRVAEKCGFREIKRLVYKDQPTALFER